MDVLTARGGVAEASSDDDVVLVGEVPGDNHADKLGLYSKLEDRKTAEGRQVQHHTLSTNTGHTACLLLIGLLSWQVYRLKNNTSTTDYYLYCVKGEWWIGEEEDIGRAEGYFWGKDNAELPHQIVTPCWKVSGRDDWLAAPAVRCVSVSNGGLEALAAHKAEVARQLQKAAHEVFMVGPAAFLENPSIPLGRYKRRTDDVHARPTYQLDKPREVGRSPCAMWWADGGWRLGPEDAVGKAEPYIMFADSDERLPYRLPSIGWEALGGKKLPAGLGCCVLKPDEPEWTQLTLYWACGLGLEAQCRLLLTGGKGDIVDRRSPDGGTPLVAACRIGSAACVARLLQAKAQVLVPSTSTCRQRATHICTSIYISTQNAYSLTPPASYPPPRFPRHKIWMFPDISRIF